MGSILGLPSRKTLTPPPPVPQRQLTVTEIAKAAQSYQAGITLREIGQQLGVDRRVVSSALKAQGVTTRYNKLGPEDLLVIVERHEAGQSLATIGEQLGVNPGTVQWAMRKAGVPTRARPGR